MSFYYQGSKFNPYGKHGDLSEAGKSRPIDVNRRNFVTLTQIRGYMPDKLNQLNGLQLVLVYLILLFLS